MTAAVLSAVFASVWRRAPPGGRALGLGLLGYLLYVLSIGGDFMGGRFFTTTYVVAVLLLARVAASLHPWALAAASLALVIPVTATSFSDRRTDPRRTECSPPDSGITDERECYVEYTGLPQNIRSGKWKRHGYLEDFRKVARAESTGVVYFNLVGLAGYGNTEEKHIVEGFALSEPFLARIRFEAQSGWRIGHLHRDIPPGYLESLRTGTNQLQTPCLRELYDRLALVRSGPIWTAARFKAIWALNTTHQGCRR
jgi:arabinofuranosyltransferase